jgi:hypothetical protein
LHKQVQEQQASIDLKEKDFEVLKQEMKYEEDLTNELKIKYGELQSKHEELKLENNQLDQDIIKFKDELI